MNLRTILTSLFRAPSGFPVGTFVIDIASSQIGIIKAARSTINGDPILRITIPAYGDIHIPSRDVRALPALSGIIHASGQILDHHFRRGITLKGRRVPASWIISIAAITITSLTMIWWIGFGTVA